MAPVILCFGDSNTFGFAAGGGRLPPDTVWPQVLQHHLGESATVRSDGVCGRYLVAPQGGMSILNGARALPQLIKPHYPDVLILQLGTNDLLAGEIGTEALGVHLENTLAEIRRIRPKLLVGVLLPSLSPGITLKEWSNTTWGTLEGRLLKLQKAFRACCIRQESLPIETNAITKDSLDGIHLNPKGHSELAGSF